MLRGDHAEGLGAPRSTALHTYGHAPSVVGNYLRVFPICLYRSSRFATARWWRHAPISTCSFTRLCWPCREGCSSTHTGLARTWHPLGVSPRSLQEFEVHV